MNLVDKAIEATRCVSGKLPTRDSLLVAFFDLEKQLDEQQQSVAELLEKLDVSEQLVGKKSEVISSHEARIRILEERLRLVTIERFASSSEKTPWQLDCFDEPDPSDDPSDEQASAEDPADDEKKPPRRKPRKGLDPRIPGSQDSARAAQAHPDRRGARRRDRHLLRHG